MKNDVLRMAGLMMFTALFVPHANAADHFKQGFYLGGAMGAGWGHAVWDGVSDIYALNYQGPPISIMERWVPEGDSMDTEFAGRAMLGYQFVFTPLLLAIEVGGTFSEDYRFERDETMEFFNSYAVILATMDTKALTNDTVTLGGSEFNVDLKPGWLIVDHFLAYGRVGLAVNKLTIDSNNLWSSTNTDIFGWPDPYTVDATASSTESKTAYGIRLGLGVEYLTTQHLGVTLDYVYSYYGNVSTSSSSSNNTADLGAVGPEYYSVSGSNAPEVTVSTQTILLGLLYHF